LGGLAFRIVRTSNGSKIICLLKSASHIRLQYSIVVVIGIPSRVGRWSRQHNRLPNWSLLHHQETLAKALAQFSSSTDSRQYGRRPHNRLRRTDCIHRPPSQPTHDAALLAPCIPSASPPSAAPSIPSPAPARLLPTGRRCKHQRSFRVSVDGRGCHRQRIRRALDHSRNTHLHANTHRHRQALARSHRPAAIGYFQGFA